MVVEIHSESPTTQDRANKVRSILEESLNPNESFKNTFGNDFVCIEKTVNRIRVFFDIYFKGKCITELKDVNVRAKL